MAEKEPFHLKMKQIRTALILLGCLFGVCIMSCRKFSPNPTWDANILAPLITTNLTIGNLVTDSLVHQNSDSSITLVYNGTLYNLNTDSLVKIPDTTIVYNYPAPFTATLPPGNPLFTIGPSYTQYGTGSAQLSKSIIQSGYVVLEVTSHVHGITDFRYRVFSATSGKDTISVTVKVPAAVGATPGYKIDSVPLNGYTVDFTGPTHNGFNSISTVMSAWIDSNGTSTSITFGDDVIIKSTFHSVVPYYAKGYFGTATKSYTETTPFNIFKKVTAGTLNLQKINVSLTLQNGFGVDGQVKITKLTSINSRTSTNVDLTALSIINNTININRATETHNPSSPVNPSIQTFNLDPSNSNILAWINNLPTSVAYSAQITTDPLGNISGSNDFVYLGYGIQSNLDISMPLSLVASNLTLADTLQVNFSATAQAQNVKSGTFTLYATNGFPFSTGLQIYLLDSITLKVKDSLMLSSQTIPAGIMNSSGIVISPTNSSIVMTLNTAQTRELITSRHILIMARFNMGTTSPLVYRTIYSYNSLGIKLVGNFDYFIKG